MARTVVINEISRAAGRERRNHLVFRPGVNIIVGARNAGKTKWMETIDYLMGDDISAEQRTTDDIFVKYDSARMTMVVNNAEMEVERRWKEARPPLRPGRVPYVIRVDQSESSRAPSSRSPGVDWAA